MGDTFSGDGYYSSSKPVHEVCLSAYLIGKYEVTQGQWRKVMGNNPSEFSACGDDCPVERVSWDDVQEFIQRLNHRTGKSYRLPTEAEWEYAARSGGKNELYSGGDNADAVAWWYDNAGKRTHPVGQKQPNGLGLYDMSGNVWEWVSDFHDYGKSPRSGPSVRFDRVFRGGSWSNLTMQVEASYRIDYSRGNRRNYLGFRLAAPVQ